MHEACLLAGSAMEINPLLWTPTILSFQAHQKLICTSSVWSRDRCINKKRILTVETLQLSIRHQVMPGMHLLLMQSHQLRMLSQSKDREWKATEWKEVISKVTKAPGLNPFRQEAVIHIYCLTKPSVTHVERRAQLWQNRQAQQLTTALLWAPSRRRELKNERSLSRLQLTA